MESTQPTAPTQSELAAQFPRWHVWRTTDAGTWWATRRGPGWNREPRTLAANTAEELRTSLFETDGAAGETR
jgi:hypothetical protein